MTCLREKKFPKKNLFVSIYIYPLLSSEKNVKKKKLAAASNSLRSFTSHFYKES